MTKTGLGDEFAEVADRLSPAYTEHAAVEAAEKYRVQSGSRSGAAGHLPPLILLMATKRPVGMDRQPLKIAQHFSIKNSSTNNPCTNCLFRHCIPIYFKLFKIGKKEKNEFFF